MGTIAARHEEKDGKMSAKVAFEEAGHRLSTTFVPAYLTFDSS